MATKENITTEIAKVETTSLQSLINKSAKELGRALPAHMNPERLVRIALTCIRLVPDLGKCTPESFLGALFVSAQLGLEPVAGRAYILPFNNNRKKPDGSWHSVKEAQFIVGYKGLADLFFRHEKAVQLAWGVVHERDEFDYQYGTDAFLKHIPAKSNRGAVLGYYVLASLQGGGKPFMFMSSEDCLAHGQRHSKTYDKKSGQFYASSPWVTATESMCLKTVLVQLCKILPLSVELQKAIATDETTREFRSGVADALDLPDNTNWVETRAIPDPSKPVSTDSIKAKVSSTDLDNGEFDREPA